VGGGGEGWGGGGGGRCSLDFGELACNTEGCNKHLHVDTINDS